MNDRGDASPSTRAQLAEANLGGLVSCIVSLADGVETSLSDELLDRQTIAEDAVTGLRELARLYGGER